MRNYLNADEKELNLILMFCAETAKQLSNSDALLENEKANLNSIIDNVNKFNQQVFERFGNSYRRKLVNTMKCNKVRLVGKYEKAISAVSECVVEDMLPMIDKFRSWQCLVCEKEDFKNCFIYNACITCDVNASSDKKCPFKL